MSQQFASDLFKTEPWQRSSLMMTDSVSLLKLQLHLINLVLSLKENASRSLTSLAKTFANLQRKQSRFHINPSTEKISIGRCCNLAQAARWSTEGEQAEHEAQQRMVPEWKTSQCFSERKCRGFIRVTRRGCLGPEHV